MITERNELVPGGQRSHVRGPGDEGDEGDGGDGGHEGGVDVVCIQHNSVWGGRGVHVHVVVTVQPCCS